MRAFVNATHTAAGICLYLIVARCGFFLAEDLKTGTIYGRFNGEWFAV